MHIYLVTPSNYIHTTTCLVLGLRQRIFTLYHRECSNIALMKIVYTIWSSVGMDVKDEKQRCQICFVTICCLLINLYDYSTH